MSACDCASCWKEKDALTRGTLTLCWGAGYPAVCGRDWTELPNVSTRNSILQDNAVTSVAVYVGVQVQPLRLARTCQGSFGYWQKGSLNTCKKRSTTWELFSVFFCNTCRWIQQCMVLPSSLSPLPPSLSPSFSASLPPLDSLLATRQVLSTFRHEVLEGPQLYSRLMHVCTCVYVCMYVCMYVCTYVCMYVHVCVCVCTYSMYVCMYAWMHICL